MYAILRVCPSSTLTGYADIGIGALNYHNVERTKDHYQGTYLKVQANHF